MIKEIKCDVLKSNANFILHQVNLQGVMGGGLAYQIAKTYPQVEMKYKKFIEECYEKHKEVFYSCQPCLIRNEPQYQFIVNMFSQTSDFKTDLNALKLCLLYLERFIFYKKLSSARFEGFENCTVAIPKYYGCGIANGNWEDVYKVFENWHNDILRRHKVDNFTLLICEL